MEINMAAWSSGSVSSFAQDISVLMVLQASSATTQPDGPKWSDGFSKLVTDTILAWQKLAEMILAPAEAARNTSTATGRSAIHNQPNHDRSRPSPL